MENSFRFEDLVYGTGLIKSGCHDPKGMMMLYGQGIRPGTHIGECTNLDIAPTLLTLLGLPVPEELNGRVLREALDDGQFN
jgi:arylsulfatase A-like enzyme